MLYQILTGNVNSLGLTTSPGTSIVVKPLVVPQMVQGSLITLDQQSASVDNTGSFSIQIAQTAKVRLVVTDGAGRQCGDIQLHITDDATADISQYLQSPPPDPLRNMYINAQLSAESAYESKILAGYQAADAQSAATTASTQAGIATTKAGEAATSATGAATSATNAAASATAAGTSATNAANSATAAAASAVVAAASLQPNRIDTDMTIPDGYNAIRFGDFEIGADVTITLLGNSQLVII